MHNNSTKLLFLMTMISGIMITISSNSWLGIWMGLEINMLSFIPIISNNENMYNMEASLKYFLIQVLSSSLLLFSIMSLSLMENINIIIKSNFMMMLLTSPLMLKSGIPPFHWWFPMIMQGLSWISCFILMTMQKMAPMITMSYIIENSTWVIFCIMLSILIGSMGGLNQTSVKKLLTYSSINHSGWMLSALMMGESIWLMYFSIYSMMVMTIIWILKSTNISLINQTFMMSNESIKKLIMYLSLLSLGGLPPFLGFLPKWMIIQFMVINNMKMLITFMVIFSLITLFYYIRITYTSMMILYSKPFWYYNLYKSSSPLMTMLVMTSMMGLLTLPLVMSFYL